MPTEFSRQDYLHEHVIFTSMVNVNELNRAGDEQMYIINAQRDVDFSPGFHNPDHWCFIGLGSEQP